MGRPERQMGDAIRAAEPPDFVAVASQATALLERSKDLRVAVQLARALTHLDGFRGLSEGLGIAHGLLERYFPKLHPELDPDEGNDPTMRITAIAGLCAADFLALLRTRPLIVSRSFGPITLRDLALATAPPSSDSEGPKLDLPAIDAAFQDCDVTAHEAASATLRTASAHVAGMEAIFDRETPGHGPDLAGLIEVLRHAQHAVLSRLERRTGGALAATDSSSDGPKGDGPKGDGAKGDAGPPTSAGLDGQIRSRADVLRALDKICDYYAEFEPSSPIPLLLQRGKRLVSKSFLDIIRDMAPDGVSQVESIAGKADA